MAMRNAHLYFPSQNFSEEAALNDSRLRARAEVVSNPCFDWINASNADPLLP